MGYYVGLDVALRSVALCVIDGDGEIVLGITVTVHLFLLVFSSFCPAYQSSFSGRIRVHHEPAVFSKHIF